MKTKNYPLSKIELKSNPHTFFFFFLISFNLNLRLKHNLCSDYLCDKKAANMWNFNFKIINFRFIILHNRRNQNNIEV
jgi:hypothetical protein